MSFGGDGDPAVEAKVVDTVDIDRVRPGGFGRQLVTLAQDGMGRPTRVPVLIARGRHDGPVLGITAALHGNELNGIPVLHRLFDQLEPRRLRGTVVGATVLNVPGYLMQQREFGDGVDLNHIFPGKPDGNGSQQYAHRILDRIVQGFDYLLDLHTASFGRINSLYVRADLTHPITARMAHLQRPELLLHNPPRDQTLRGAAMELGIPAITVEIGNPHRFQRRYIKQSFLGIRAVMSELGMIPKFRLREGGEPIVCSQSEWLYTRTGGLLEVLPELLDVVAEGELIARLTNVFGDVIDEFRAPGAGVVIGRSVNPVASSGARIVHLGRVSSEPDVFLDRTAAKLSPVKGVEPG